MSRETEKVTKQLIQYMEDHQEELVQEYIENHYLLDSVGPFFDWAYRSLKKSSSSAKTSN